MKKRLFAGVLLAALVVGFTAWYSRYAPGRVRADALPPSVLALLPQAARYEKQTTEVYIEQYHEETDTREPVVTRASLVFCYDEDGRVICELTYDPDEIEPVLVTDHTYNAEGKPLSRIVRSGGEITSSLFFTYGPDGHELSREAHLTGLSVKTTFRYDAAGQKIGDIVQYAADGSEQSHSAYYYDDKDRTIRAEDGEGNVESTAEHTYDAHGQLIRSVSYRDGKQQMDYRVERTYNETGKPLTETIFIDGKRHEYMEYAYDSNGWLTSQLVYDGDGKLFSRTTCEQITRP